jgi:hypothetical protein
MYRLEFTTEACWFIGGAAITPSLESFGNLKYIIS